MELEAGLRARDRLTAISIRRPWEPGLYPDGAGLYLQVTETGTKSWIFKITLRGRARQMGLGTTALVSLSEARLKRDAAQRLLLDGIDPIEARRDARQAKQLAAVKAVTFQEAATRYYGASATGLTAGGALPHGGNQAMRRRSLQLYGSSALIVCAISFGVMNEGKAHGACSGGATGCMRTNSIGSPVGVISQQNLVM